MRADGARPGVVGADAQLVTLGRLTQGALHELANPLLSLLGNTEFALADAPPGTKLHERLEAVQRMALEIAEIMSALQGYIREQHGPATSVSLVDSAEAAVSLVRRVSAAQGVKLGLRVEAEPVVQAQPGSVLRSLVELLLDGLADPERGGALELVVSERDGEPVVSVVGRGERRLGSAARSGPPSARTGSW